MGITINGSSSAGTIDLGTNGTITDLAVGGVPDNTIDNGAMADDAIGVAELSATGTASSSTYLRGDNSWASLTTGKILQVVPANSDTNTQFTNQTSYADHTNHTISITPTVSGSKIVLLAQFRFTVIKNHVETNSRWRLVLTIGSGSATYPLGADMNETVEAGKSTNNRTGLTVQVPVNYTTGATSNTTDAYVFKIQGKNNSSSDDSESQAKYWRAIAMEVAA